MTPQWQNNLAMEFLVRPSTEADVTGIAQIYAHHVLHSTSTYELKPPGRDEISARRSSILRAGMPHLVAEEAGEVVGYAYAGPYRPRPGYRFTIEDSIYIHPDHLGRGC